MTISGPGVSSWSSNRLDVFVRGADQALYTIAWDGSQWSDYVQLGTNPFLDSPAAVSWGPNRIDVFVRGTDNALYTKAWDGTHWSDYVQLGANPFLDSPAAASWGPNRIDVFVRGTDNALYTKAWDGIQWSDYVQLGSNPFVGSPAAVSWGPNRIDVFVRGTDNALYTKAWDGSYWTDYVQVAPNPFLGGPAAASWASDRIDLFVRGTDNALYTKAWVGSHWSGYVQLGAGPFLDNPAAVSRGTNRIDVFVRGTDDNLYTKAWDGNAWSGYYSLGHPIPAQPVPTNLAGAKVFEHPSSVGQRAVLSLPATQRYDVRRFNDLAPSNLARLISSAELSPGSDPGSESSLYLFGGSSPVANTDYRKSIPYSLLNSREPLPFIQDFHGSFLRLSAPPAGPPFMLNDLRNQGFDDKATSVMLVNRWKNGKGEQTISAKNTFTLPWNTALTIAIPLIQLAVGGVAISRIGDPLFTWKAFPRNQQRLTDSEIYMVLSQWFVFHAWGIGINLWLMFYFRFFVNNGRIAMNIVDMDRYVWPGTGAGQAEQAIDNNKNGITNALQIFSTGMLQSGVLHSACDDVYLLPGTQPDSKATGNSSTTDDALDDVTIVVENARAVP